MLSFMTDKEKLQQLFDAALKSPTEFSGGPQKRAFPKTPTPHAAAVGCDRLADSEPSVLPQEELTATAAAQHTPVAEAPAAILVAPALDKAAADALGVLLDEKVKKAARRHRRELVVTAIVFFGSIGGGLGWFVQSPERVDAFTSAIREIRSVGDVKSLVAKYQAALDRVATRSQQIDQAAAAMGMKPGKADDKDPFMDAEMGQMMGGEGKTVGQRSRALEAGLGDMAEEHGGVPNSTAALEEGDSFDWNE